MGWFSKLFASAKVLTPHEQWLLDEWYTRKVAKYHEAEQESDELYNGFIGSTFKRFMNNNATEDVNVTQAEMEQMLTNKGHRSNMVCGKLHFYGVRIVLHGDVSQGNWGT
jgi:hypothetical protein